MSQSNGPDLTLDESTCIFGAGVLQKHLEAFDKEIAGVRSGEKDPEFIHKSRVASRRLRAALPLFIDCFPHKKSKTWLKEIRKITRALGQARDVDVQIAQLEKFSKKAEDFHLKPGAARLLLRLRQQREKLDSPVAKAIKKLDQHDLVKNMQAELSRLLERSENVYLYTPALYQNSFNAILFRLNNFLAYEPIVSQPEKVTELHEMRIAAKWLRYTLENFAPLYSNELKPYLQAIKQAQELLGDIHDCDVWRMFLPQFLTEERQRTLEYFGHTRSFGRLLPGIIAFEQDRIQARNKTYATFRQEWDNWQQENLWGELRKTIQVPFPQPSQLYPPSHPPVSSEKAAEAPAVNLDPKVADTHEANSGDTKHSPIKIYDAG